MRIIKNLGNNIIGIFTLINIQINDNFNLAFGKRMIKAIYRKFKSDL